MNKSTPSVLIVLIVIMFLLGSSSQTFAQTPGQYRLFFTSQSAKPDTSDRDEAGQPLDDEHITRVLTVDLNKDGSPESFETSYVMCGSGGCIWALYDGRTKRELGSIEGAIIYVSRSQPGHFPNLESYWKCGGGCGLVHYYIYSKGMYRETKTISLEGDKIDKYFNEKPSIDKEGLELQ